MEEEDHLTNLDLDNLHHLHLDLATIWVPILGAVDTALEATVAAVKVDHHLTRWVPILEAADTDL
jgi:hypothetical protein